jgi:hypothetical protein
LNLQVTVVANGAAIVAHNVVQVRCSFVNFEFATAVKLEATPVAVKRGAVVALCPTIVVGFGRFLRALFNGLFLHD